MKARLVRLCCVSLANVLNLNEPYYKFAAVKPKTLKLPKITYFVVLGRCDNMNFFQELIDIQLQHYVYYRRRLFHCFHARLNELKFTYYT